MEKEHKKKLSIWIKIAISVVSIIIVILVSTIIFINVELNKINDINEVEVVPPEEEYFETASSEEEYIEIAPSTKDNSKELVIEDKSNITWPTDNEGLQDDDIINILLVGQDRRPGETRARSDTMMIATLNQKDDTVKLTSIMRDLYVQIPGYSDNRINSAYAFGGMKLLDKTIEKNFQVHIDYNIEVDFERFIKVIDKLGKVDVPINKKEAEYLGVQGFAGLSEGMVQMDGSMALAYCRIRYVGNADYERTDRQRRVIKSEFNKVKGLGLNKILDLVNEIFPLVGTDLSNGEMIKYATSVAMMGVEDIGTLRIPVNDTYTGKRIRGMSVLVPDLDKNRKALKDFIYN